MYGHADRIGRQVLASGKAPELLEYFLKGAYNRKMTTSDSTQRDELARIIHSSRKPWVTNSEHSAMEAIQADAILAAGYRKPRTITTVEELRALPDGSAILDSSGDVGQKLSEWWYFPETAPMGSSKVAKYGPVTALHEPQAEAAQ